MENSNPVLFSSSVHLVSPDVRHIIRHEYSVLDEKLPTYMELLSRYMFALVFFLLSLLRNGADECWHKHGTFKEHLFGTWRYSVLPTPSPNFSSCRILRLWGQSEAICRLGLFHSIYSNDYVNLAIFDCNQERDYLKDLLGEAVSIESLQLTLLTCRLRT